jgi:hypothetical protein
VAENGSAPGARQFSDSQSNVTTLVAGCCFSDLLACFRRVFPAGQVSVADSPLSVARMLRPPGEVA